MKKIVLTGGGTAGHVTPNIALMPSLIEEGYEIEYIGSYTGIEKQLIEAENIPYHCISSGKLRRYFSTKNFSDIFRVLRGIIQANRLLRKIKPDVVFSKGGFVSVPVCLAAGFRHIPVIIHESDMTPGLANRIAMKKATNVCCNFPETVKYLPEGKAVLTGSPIRQELLKGDKNAGLRLCGFNDKKPIILVVGGSTGAKHVNDAIYDVLPELLEKYQVCHLCGKGKTEPKYDTLPGYKQFEYISEEMKDLFAMADIVVSRAGANAICELLALKKPNLLIPLSAKASRGDQILNAKSFKEHGYSLVLDEDELIKDDKIQGKLLLDEINKLYDNKDSFISKMSESKQADSIANIIELIKKNTK
ncbi:undecaprenyldiphospho-muramoylpentapeptide beta-N-acetylglucosaminyltransferase [Lachnospira multipara]|jgi:UDP-N-acetylglucosamine--N-acetylmuramyl-(pentapeptide) pyrophosphoryl-undecaprenol N-acetylglucosamine transferase|uniref:undecaprenyldiphospho-muramoylpentapeptide beta-N-acetylglucosaminyltransferase n=1 Tax=Lachnospira multipara TaxID=28051 RepID=UPI00047FFF23|nr:undecaprenyldiphospho-muramoylpentapeptide beta-N-acetylglucosaminyltransferase [Lachnospira multipara]